MRVGVDNGCIRKRIVRGRGLEKLYPTADISSEMPHLQVIQWEKNKTSNNTHPAYRADTPTHPHPHTLVLPLPLVVQVPQVYRVLDNGLQRVQEQREALQHSHVCVRMCVCMCIVRCVPVRY